MEKNKLLYTTIGLLVLSQLWNAFQIKNLEQKIIQNQNNIIYVENNLNNQISNIYSNVDKKMTEYTSLISTCYYDIDEFELDTLTVPITFTVQPKTLTDYTRIYLDFEGEKQELKRDGSKFTLTKNCAIKDHTTPTVIIENKDTQQFEQHENLRVYNLVEKVFPTVKLEFIGSISQRTTHFKINGEIGIFEYFTGANNYFTDGKCVVSIDNKEVKSYEITDFEHFNLEIDDEFELLDGQKLIYKFIYTDKNGIVYEQFMFEEIGYPDDKNTPEFEESPVPFADLYTTITAPDGRLIYKFDESNY